MGLTSGQSLTVLCMHNVEVEIMYNAAMKLVIELNNTSK